MINVREMATAKELSVHKCDQMEVVSVDFDRKFDTVTGPMSGMLGTYHCELRLTAEVIAETGRMTEQAIENVHKMMINKLYSDAIDRLMIAKHHIYAGERSDALGIIDRLIDDME